MKWNDHVEAWSRPPVDDVGYLSSEDLMSMGDTQLNLTIMQMAHIRYGGWRNYGGLWREMLHLDDTHGKDVLDFGCGVGMEARELQEVGNYVSLADISEANLRLAYRVLRLGDHDPESIDLYRVTDEPPYITAEPGSFDVIHCSGVLHHIPWAREIMIRFHEILRPGGEVRLMLYSDYGWCQATGDEDLPHWSANTASLPGFERFVSFMDSVGTYADWYNRDKLEIRFGDLFDVTDFAYLTEDLRFCAAVLTRKDHAVILERLKS
jgi:2-polyprenyl-3-methyl-5-hydroxy-6-metoxy-1,4-benzoquinol methylase